MTDDEIEQVVEEDYFPEDYNESVASPYPEKKDNTMRFLRDILNLGKLDHHKALRVANLKERELGMLPSSVRNYSDIANFCDLEGWNKVGDYLRAKADVILASSLSRAGFLAQLAVTNKRVSKQVGERVVQTEKKLFGGEKKIVTGDEE